MDSDTDAGINRFQLNVEDCRIRKDDTQELSLTERLKADKVDVALTNAKNFLGSYSATNPQKLTVSITDGDVGEGAIKGSRIELRLPPSENVSIQMRSFVDKMLRNSSEDARNSISNELALALSSSTILHEGVHGLLDSKPGSKFAHDLERVSGLTNERGEQSTLLDEGIAYAIQGVYAPSVVSLGSLVPTPREGEREEVRARKELGTKLRPKIEEYLKTNRRLDDEFLSFASEQLKVSPQERT